MMAAMRIIVGDVRLYFDVDGSGLRAEAATMVPRPTLILLHGGPGADHSFFKPECAALTDVAQVVYLDQRGCGRSDPGDPSSWNWIRWADDVADFCAALDISRPVLVGSTSGAVVALVCAARHPDLVSALVLDSALGVPTTLEESVCVFESRGGPVAAAAARRYLGGDTGEEATEAWQKHCLPLYDNASDPNNFHTRIARAVMNDAVQEHFRAGRCGPADLGPHGPAVICPVLVLAGEHDPVSPAAAAQRLPQALPNAEVSVHVLPVGHGVLRQAPQQSLRLIRQFLLRGPAKPGTP